VTQEIKDQKVYLFHDISYRLFDTLFGCPLEKGRIVLLAADLDSTLTVTSLGNFELGTLDGGKFVISSKGKLLSETSPSRHQIDYCYDKLKEGKVTAVHSYITDDGKIVKDSEETIFRGTKPQ